MTKVLEGAIEIEHKPSSVILPNGQVMHLNKSYLLPTPASVPRAARITLSFPHLTDGALLSIRQLYNNSFIVVFCSAKVEIYHNNTIVLTVQRKYKNRLWHTNMSNNKTGTIINSNSNPST